MNQPSITDIVGLFVFMSALIFSNEVANVVAPYIVIAVAATVGASFSVARRDRTTRTGAVWFFLKVVALAILITAFIAIGVSKYYPVLNERELLAPVALLVGFIGDRWPLVLTKIVQFFLGMLDLARGKGGTP